jgi:hypothetical protein
MNLLVSDLVAMILGWTHLESHSPISEVFLLESSVSVVSVAGASPLWWFIHSRILARTDEDTLGRSIGVSWTPRSDCQWWTCRKEGNVDVRGLGDEGTGWYDLWLRIVGRLR